MTLAKEWEDKVLQLQYKCSDLMLILRNADHDEETICSSAVDLDIHERPSDNKLALWVLQ